MAVEHPRSGWERQGTVLRKAALAIFALWPTSRSRGSLEAKPEVKEDDQFSDAETVARREAALKRTLPTPHMANPKRELSVAVLGVGDQHVGRKAMREGTDLARRAAGGRLPRERERAVAGL